jgi:hypothetical protein
MCTQPSTRKKLPLHPPLVRHEVPPESSKARLRAWKGKVPIFSRVRVFLTSDQSLVGEGEYCGQEAKLQQAAQLAAAQNIKVFGNRGTDHLSAEYRSTLQHAKICLDSGQTIYDDDQTDAGMNKYYWFEIESK